MNRALAGALTFGLAAIAVFALPGNVAAQTVRPRPEDAAALLQNRPDLVAQIRQRMMASNLTPDQIRARLKAEGYPENLLDDYMAGSKTTNVSAPNSNVFAAIRALGIADSIDVADLERLNDAANRAPRRKPAAAIVDSGASSDTTLSRVSAELFGLSLFRDASTRFQTNLDGPVDAEYKLGP
ncbi:MAG: hypothetical protein ABJB66_03295, partial [Gemmatimonadaceae bacterium]